MSASSQTPVKRQWAKPLVTCGDGSFTLPPACFISTPHLVMMHLVVGIWIRSDRYVQKIRTLECIRMGQRVPGSRVCPVPDLDPDAFTPFPARYAPPYGPGFYDLSVLNADRAGGGDSDQEKSLVDLGWPRLRQRLRASSPWRL